jgi:hypothetical protein
MLASFSFSGVILKQGQKETSAIRELAAWAKTAIIIRAKEEEIPRMMWFPGDIVVKPKQGPRRR